MEQGLERRGQQHSRQMLISHRISPADTSFFQWRVKSWHKISLFWFCVCQTPPRPLLGLTTLALLPLLPAFSDQPPWEPTAPASNKRVLCRQVSSSSSCSFLLWTPPCKLQNCTHSSEVARSFTLCVLTACLHHSLTWTHSYLSQTWGQTTYWLYSPQSLFLSSIEKYILIQVAHPSTGKLPTFNQSLPPIFEIILLISQILGTSRIPLFTAG